MLLRALDPAAGFGLGLQSPPQTCAALGRRARSACPVLSCRLNPAADRVKFRVAASTCGRAVRGRPAGLHAIQRTQPGACAGQRQQLPLDHRQPGGALPAGVSRPRQPAARPLALPPGGLGQVRAARLARARVALGGSQPRGPRWVPWTAFWAGACLGLTSGSTHSADGPRARRAWGYKHIVLPWTWLKTPA